MPGKLRCDAIDLNQPVVVQRLLHALINLARSSANIHPLNIHGKYYFTVPTGPITSEAGWYIICDEKRHPIYVGTAANLNSRLNTKDGSRDNFANPQRRTDDARNFIKKFVSTGAINTLSVITVPEPTLCEQAVIRPPLSKLDRKNIEKVLSIFRVAIIG